jgi:hypothetical protein
MVRLGGHFGEPSRTPTEPSLPIAALGTVIELLQKVNKAVISFPYSCSGFYK